jgi:hypothetical protein
MVNEMKPPSFKTESQRGCTTSKKERERRRRGEDGMGRRVISSGLRKAAQ